MSHELPIWATSEEEKELWGEAVGGGAPPSVLSNKHACVGFVRSKKPAAGNVLLLLLLPLLLLLLLLPLLLLLLFLLPLMFR